MSFTAKDLIGGIDVTAPLWNKTEPRELHAIVAALSDASYHYADDSGKEWSAGNGEVQRAAKAVNAAGLGHYAITCLHRHTSQLVTLDRFMDAILKDARPASPDVRVVVKPLEWRKQSGACEIADTPWGAVAVQDESHALAPKRWGWWVVGSGEDDSPSGYGIDIDAAKAAAQADYERRILSAIIAGQP